VSSNFPEKKTAGARACPACPEPVEGPVPTCPELCRGSGIEGSNVEGAEGVSKIKGAASCPREQNGRLRKYSLLLGENALRRPRGNNNVNHHLDRGFRPFSLRGDEAENRDLRWIPRYGRTHLCHLTQVGRFFQRKMLHHGIGDVPSIVPLLRYEFLDARDAYSGAVIKPLMDPSVFHAVSGRLFTAVLANNRNEGSVRFVYRKHHNGFRFLLPADFAVHIRSPLLSISELF